MRVQKFILILLILMIDLTCVFCSASRTERTDNLVNDYSRKQHGDCLSCQKWAWLDQSESCVSCTHSTEKNVRGETQDKFEPSLACKEVRDRYDSEVSQRKQKIRKLSKQGKEQNCCEVLIGLGRYL